MEKIKYFLEKSSTHLKTADHLTYITYPLINDTKITITILENLYLSLLYAMSAILYYDRLFKRISQYPENFESKFEIFKTNCAKRYNIDRDCIDLIYTIRDIIKKHKQSPIEFIRKDKFVIASDTYRLQTITINKIKEYLKRTKPFIQKINTILEKNDRYFRRI